MSIWIHDFVSLEGNRISKIYLLSIMKRKIDLTLYKLFYRFLTIPMVAGCMTIC